ncbi:hypothetical protein BASA60_000939 [Batrachochytrium salamandrivorans]|nr:hypothetical protein BASA60_000939 [Batrachochytrium salamandrivorans]
MSDWDASKTLPLESNSHRDSFPSRHSNSIDRCYIAGDTSTHTTWGTDGVMQVPSVINPLPMLQQNRSGCQSHSRLAFHPKPQPHDSSQKNPLSAENHLLIMRPCLDSSQSQLGALFINRRLHDETKHMKVVSVLPISDEPAQPHTRYPARLHRLNHIIQKEKSAEHESLLHDSVSSALASLMASTPHSEHEEIQQRIGIALITEINDLHKEIATLIKIKTDYAKATEIVVSAEESRRFSGSVLQQRIHLVVDRIRDDLAFNRSRDDANRDALNSGGCNSRCSSQQINRPMSATASLMEEYNDRDAIVSIRYSLEEERQELLQKLESIYAQIDLERDVRKQTIKLGLTKSKTILELTTSTEVAENDLQYKECVVNRDRNSTLNEPPHQRNLQQIQANNSCAINKCTDSHENNKMDHRQGSTTEDNHMHETQLEAIYLLDELEKLDSAFSFPVIPVNQAKQDKTSPTRSESGYLSTSSSTLSISPSWPHAETPNITTPAPSHRLPTGVSIGPLDRSLGTMESYPTELDPCGNTGSDSHLHYATAIALNSTSSVKRPTSPPMKPINQLRPSPPRSKTSTRTIEGSVIR